jgi:hypothetical protein
MINKKVLFEEVILDNLEKAKNAKLMIETQQHHYWLIK